MMSNELLAAARFELIFESGHEHEPSSTEILRKMQELSAANDAEPELEKVA